MSFEWKRRDGTYSEPDSVGYVRLEYGLEWSGNGYCIEAELKTPIMDKKLFASKFWKFCQRYFRKQEKELRKTYWLTE